MLSDVRIEPATVRIPGERASDRATVPGLFACLFIPIKIAIKININVIQQTA